MTSPDASEVATPAPRSRTGRFRWPARAACLMLTVPLGACDGCRHGDLAVAPSPSPAAPADSGGSGDVAGEVDAAAEPALLEAVWSVPAGARIVAVAFDDARGVAVATSAGTVEVVDGDGVAATWGSDPRLASTVALAWAPGAQGGLLAATRGEEPVVARLGGAGAPVDVVYTLTGQPVDVRVDASGAVLVLRLLVHTEEGSALLTLHLAPEPVLSPSGDAAADAPGSGGAGPEGGAAEAGDGSGSSAGTGSVASLVDQHRLCAGAAGFFDVPGGHAVPCHDSQELVHLSWPTGGAESRTSLGFRPVAVVAVPGGLGVASAATSEIAIQTVGAARLVPLDGPASALAAVGDDVVAASPGASRLTRVTAGGEAAATSEAAAFPVAMAVSDAGLWVLDADLSHPRVLLLDPQTLTERASAPVGGRPAWVRVVGSGVVVVSPGEGLVERFELRDR